MNWFERLYRKYEVKFLGKKYCSMTKRVGHNLKYEYRGGKGIARFVVYSCETCKDKFIQDMMGISKS